MKLCEWYWYTNNKYLHQIPRHNLVSRLEAKNVYLLHITWHLPCILTSYSFIFTTNTCLITNKEGLFFFDVTKNIFLRSKKYLWVSKVQMKLLSYQIIKHIKFPVHDCVVLNMTTSYQNAHRCILYNIKYIDLEFWYL